MKKVDSFKKRAGGLQLRVYDEGTNPKKDYEFKYIPLKSFEPWCVYKFGLTGQVRVFVVNDKYVRFTDWWSIMEEEDQLFILGLYVNKC